MINYKDQYGTYETQDAWITPLCDYNIIHYDCPTAEEIEQRVSESINEIVSGEGFEEGCPLCEMMAKGPYDITYYCTIPCCECSKAAVCKNVHEQSE